MTNQGENIFLEVKNLKTHFHLDEGTVKAVDGVSFKMKKARPLAL